MLAASVPVLGAFARHQIRRKRAGAATLVEPSVFRSRSYVSGVVFAMVFLGSMGGLTLALTVFMQIGLGYSPIEASLTSAPYALGGFIGSAIGGIDDGPARPHRAPRRARDDGRRRRARCTSCSSWPARASATCTSPRRCWSAGIGMGMVFVPLFDIILAGVGRPRGRLGIGRAAGAPAARHVARRRRPRDDLLRPASARRPAARPTSWPRPSRRSSSPWRCWPPRSRSASCSRSTPAPWREGIGRARRCRRARMRRSRGVRVPLLVGRDLEERHHDAGGVACRVVLGHEAVQAQLEVAADAEPPLLLQRAGDTLLAVTTGKPWMPRPVRQRLVSRFWYVA